MSQNQNKRTKTVLIGVTIITVLIIAGYFLATRNNVFWNETYQPKDTQPYGTSVLRSLLENIRQDQEFIFISDSTFEQLPTNPTDKVDSYVYVGSDFYADERDNDTLIKFLEAGNTVIISANSLNNDLINKVFKINEIPVYEELENNESEYSTEEYDELENDETTYSEEEYEAPIYIPISTEETMQDSIFLQTRDEVLDRIKLSYVFEFDTIPADWKFFSDNQPSEVRTEGFFTITRNKSSIKHTNFISVEVGNGRLYLHLTPLVFTNYSLLNKDHMLYVREVFQHLGKGKVYWGEDNRIYSSKRDKSSIDSETPSEGPMEFILSEPSLRSAWYTLLFGSILYIIFGVKRKQRVIPITESMQNTSIEYAEVISQLFMEQADHKKLVDLKMDMFKSNLREKYNIKSPSSFEEENEEFFKFVSLKTGTSFELIQEIFQRYKSFTKNIIVETPEMLVFNQKIEAFYSTSR